MKKRMQEGRKLLSITVKLGVSILFIGYLFTDIKWVEVWQNFQEADVQYLSLYVVLGFLVIFINSIKWRALAQSQGIRATLPYLVSLYLVGSFFNNFLPTSVGGDFVRGYVLGKAHAKPMDAMASVFVERFTGYTVLVIVGLLAVICDVTIRSDLRLIGPIVLALVTYLGCLWLVVNASWLRMVEYWCPAKLLRKCLARFGAFQQATQLYRKQPGTLIIALCFSACFYFLSVVMVYVGCLTFRTEVSFIGLLSAVPVLLILFMIPFSFGGIGVQEWAYYFVLTSLDVPASVGVSLGLLFRARSVMFGLIGGALYPFFSLSSSLPARHLRTTEIAPLNS